MFNGWEAWAAWSPLAALCQVMWGAGPAHTHALAQVWAAGVAVLVALVVDHRWGEPPARLHPVVYMGKLLHYFGKKIAPSQDSSLYCKSFVLGSIVWIGLIAIVVAVYAGLQQSVQWAPLWLQALAVGVLLKPLLAWRMLAQEVQAVESALCVSLAQGRTRLSWLVSRDTAALDAGQVRESVIETLAENLSDSVIAPLLWFAVLGLPGAAAYRMANTADAMWGYPSWRGQGPERRYWQWAGKWAARADDVLNWVPARLTALLLVCVSGPVGWHALRRDAVVTPSPNGGWPMGAMAQALRVRLAKPGVYVLNPQGQVPQAAHVAQAMGLAARAVAGVFISVALAVGALGIWGVGRYVF